MTKVVTRRTCPWGSDDYHASATFTPCRADPAVSAANDVRAAPAAAVSTLTTALPPAGHTGEPGLHVGAISVPPRARNDIQRRRAGTTVPSTTCGLSEQKHSKRQGRKLRPAGRPPIAGASKPTEA